ncbi:MAG: IPT/TIG domain-containing protein, partial [Chloroflexota bacterium]
MQKILARIGILVTVLLLIEYGAVPYHVQAATVNISPSSGIVGTTVTISSSDFGANETGITVKYDGVAITTTPSTPSANSTGGWSATFVVPASRSGSHTVTASGSLTATVTTNFNVTPSISVSPTRAGPRSTVTITGTGFGANETGITVTYYTTISSYTTMVTNPTTISVDTSGSWTATFVVPASTAGGHIVGASGSVTTAAATTTLTVIPGISVNPVRGAPWSSATITGSGFGASETNISVTWEGQVLTTVPASPSADTQGGWTATFIVPASSPGSHTIVASGSSGSASVSFTIAAGITVSPASAAPGTTLIVSGSAFNASETGIRITYDGTVQPTTPTVVSADSQGSWSATFAAPASRSGAHTIGASGVTPLVTTTFYITPGISIGRSSGAPGSSITVTGSGFGAGERSISVTYDRTVVASVPQADSLGGWTTTFTIPASPSGSPHTIDAYSSTTQDAAVADQTFTIVPGISINRSSGAPESSVTVTGSGFAANEKNITVTYNSKTVASGITANSNGGW